MASLLKKHGLDPKGHIYIADSALVNEGNLSSIEQTGQPFVSRLPAVYKEEQRAIDAAFEADRRTPVDVLAQKEDPSKKRPSARYKVFETTVTLYGNSYRAIVVHSSAHDKRRMKKLEKQLAADGEDFRKICKKLKQMYFLKKAERIEALGFILLLSLMIWNLIQHLIRKDIKSRQTTILGWDNKQTTATKRITSALWDFQNPYLPSPLKLTETK